MGYWQDEKYFRDIKELIRKEFGITHSLISDDSTSIRIDSSEICLGVHVRRGDYLQPGQQSSNLSALSIDYYKSAIDLVRSHCSVSKIVIVSDDPQWCRSKFRGKEFSFSSNVSTVHDFKLLNSCDHVVISNSTFSWWAAWLKTGNSHKVVAPRCWYSNGREFASFPEDWNLI